MPRRTAIGIVTSDKSKKTRRVEIPRIVVHPKYGKYIRRRTICHVHDENEESKLGDTVEIMECPPKSRLKRWEFMRVVAKSRAVDLAGMRSRAQGSGEASGSTGK